MSTGQQELHKAYREGQEKYIYFMLAAAGGAIAFAVTQTQTATLSLSKIPLAFSVLSWGFSFFCGLRQILQSSNLLYENYQLLRMKAGELQGFDPRYVQTILSVIEEKAKRSGKWANWQFDLLITGAVFYIAWHIVEMYLRTP